MKILLVDDDPLSVEFMRMFLEADGHTTVSAGTLAEARASYEHDQPQVVITDIELTDGSGVALAQYAKANFEKAAGVPKVIGVTGYSQLYLEESGQDVASFDLILTKPLELIKLKQALA